MSVILTPAAPVTYASGEPVVTAERGRVEVALLDHHGVPFAACPMDADGVRALIAALTVSLARLDRAESVETAIADAYAAAIADDHLDQVHAWLAAHPLDV